MKNCEKNGCPRAATHAPRLSIPAKGWAIELHQPLQMFCGVELCRDHAGEFFAGDAPRFWQENPKLRQAVEIMAAGKAPPDFDRTFADVVRIDSSVYRKFQDMQAAARK